MVCYLFKGIAVTFEEQIEDEDGCVLGCCIL